MRRRYRDISVDPRMARSQFSAGAEVGFEPATFRLWGRVDKFDPISDSGELQHSEEVLGQPVVAPSDGAAHLEVAERSLDLVAQPIEAFVPADGSLAVGAPRDHGPDAARSQIGADGVAVVALVGKLHQGLFLRQIDKRVVALAVSRFAAGEMEDERQAGGITDTINLTGESAPRAAKWLFASPPFAPEADTWPRTGVGSML